MIAQRSVLELLNERPVTETANWIVGEPRMQDMLADPVMHAVLRRDGLNFGDLQRALAEARRRLAAPLAARAARALPASDAA
jgi:hypothetical protein